MSCFDWIYDDKKICFLLEGEVAGRPDAREPVNFCVVDLVVFPTGMKCKWRCL